VAKAEASPAEAKGESETLSFLTRPRDHPSPLPLLYLASVQPPRPSLPLLGARRWHLHFPPALSPHVAKPCLMFYTCSLDLRPAKMEFPPS
jgi:hypothetical protein